MNTTIEYDNAIKLMSDEWIPANGGTERTTTYRNGKRLLYCFNPAKSRHAYLDVDRDIILSNEEAMDYIS